MPDGKLDGYLSDPDGFLAKQYMDSPKSHWNFHSIYTLGRKINTLYVHCCLEVTLEGYKTYRECVSGAA